MTTASPPSSSGAPGKKPFCAGGDCIDMYHAMVADPTVGNSFARNFYRDEYSLYHFMRRYPKPVLCWATGFTMGGGMGMMTSASHRVGTETSVFAMPEISIGLFPDVGASHFLHRHTPGRSGLFLGLTGSRFNSADALGLGLVSHRLPSGGYREMLRALGAVPWTDRPDENKSLATACLDDLGKDLPLEPQDCLVKRHLPAIGRLAGCSSPLEFAANLREERLEGDWLETARRNFLGRLPHHRPTSSSSSAGGPRACPWPASSAWNTTLPCNAWPTPTSGKASAPSSSTGTTPPAGLPPPCGKSPRNGIDGHFAPPCPPGEHPMKSLA